VNLKDQHNQLDNQLYWNITDMLDKPLFRQIKLDGQLWDQIDRHNKPDHQLNSLRREMARKLKEEV